MVGYDEDADSGDISLSFPISRSSPHLSTIVKDSPDDLTPGPSSRRHYRDVSSPTPQRSTRLQSSQTNKALPPDPLPLVTSQSGLVASSTSSSVSLNDSPTSTGPRPGSSRLHQVIIAETDERDIDTPLAGGSFWGIQEPVRPSSADPRSPDHATPSSSSRIPTRPMARRTSSGNTVGRSRSLNLHVRVPSYDLSSQDASQPGPSGSGKKRTPSSAVDPYPSTRLGWQRRPGEPRPPPLVASSTAERMGRWIKEIVVCNFDLERGPVVERRIMGRRWGPGEKENVAFSSFPDTSLFTEGSIVFSFKIRHIPPDPQTLHHPEPPSPMPDSGIQVFPTGSGFTPVKANGSGTLSPSDVQTPSPGPEPMLSTGQKAEEYRKWDERGREWLYGFVWFEQRRDGGVARGYMQKSLVILTHLPFPSLFSAILHRIAPSFFEHGYSALEAACHSIASWPDPVPDRTLELPFMSHVITVKLPDTNETPQLGHAFHPPSPENPIPASLPSSTPLRTFSSCLASIWSIWECLVLAEPVLVIAPDPRMCSEIVWWLRDLLRPIPPAGDFRPYLHIHDHDFSLLVNSNKPQAGIVVGVTNPYFRNAASHWPNVISISPSKPLRPKRAGSGPGPPSRPEQPDGFQSRRHRSVSKDRVLLKRLEALVAEGKLDDPAGNEALRTHFQQLTERFLVPLNRYFQTLVPTLQPSPIPSPNPALTPSTSANSVNSASSHLSTSSNSLNSLKPFSLPAFLAHLKNHGPNPLSFRNKGLTTKTRVESDFYASFCMSATFAGWLAGRVESLGIAVAAHAELGGLVPSHSESSLSVPPTPTKSGQGLGVGLEGELKRLSMISSGQGSSTPSVNARSRSGSVAGRLSMSDASTTSMDWRDSGEVPRDAGPKDS